METSKKHGLNTNALKLIAIIAMLIDHFAWFFLESSSVEGQISHFIGRLTAPIMCYFVVQGFIHTASIKKYLLRLLLFAAISHFPFCLCFGLSWYKYTSVIFSLLLGLISLCVIENERLPVILKPIILAGLLLLAKNADWSYVAVIWVIIFYCFRSSIKLQALFFAISGIAFYVIPFWLKASYPAWYLFGILLAIPIIALYNGERGRKNALTKWGFYVFYPLHIILLWLIKNYVL